MTKEVDTSADIDEKIITLFEVISLAKEQVEQAVTETKQPWKTNCSYHKDVGSPPINIQTASEKMLTMILAESLMQADYYTKAASILGSDPTLPSGYSLDEWVDDFKKRIAIINLRVKRDNLNELEKRLNKIVSPEQIRKMELDAITKQLGI